MLLGLKNRNRSITKTAFYFISFYRTQTMVDLDKLHIHTIKFTIFIPYITFTRFVNALLFAQSLEFLWF